MNEIEELKRRVDLLEFKLNEFRKPDSYSFSRTLFVTIGTKLGFFGATPIPQPSSTGETSGHFGGGATELYLNDTYSGNVGSTKYTIPDVIKHLKNLGILKK